MTEKGPMAKVSDVGVRKPNPRYQAGMRSAEGTGRYWIFKSGGEYVWYQVAGQAAARAAAGQVVANFALHYSTAGEALRVMETLSSSDGWTIANLAQLEALAQSDPEPASGAAMAWAARKGAKK